ncbi:hypothetical protein ACQKP0_07725 [Heyndrickxia sp. NPDC080065]|uniref:hypothetical protein n=1 Tax=Heyndrickxia sp. NPDC080065 TaxID=3390568 RepID=UPI003D051AAB
MKRIGLLIFMALIFSSLGSITVFGENVMMDQVEKALKEEFTYYDNHSAKVLDEMETNTNVIENEEKYEKNIKVLYISFQEVRGEIYYWDNSQIYYYDVAENKMIDSSKIEINDSINTFIKKHDNVGEKEIRTGSFLILMTSIILLVIVPLIIAFFHNGSRSRENLTIYKNNRVTF